MGKNRFTIHNEDDGGIIISKSLMDQMKKQPSPAPPPATSSMSSSKDNVPPMPKPVADEVPFVQKSAGHFAQPPPSPQPATPEGFPSMYPNLQAPFSQPMPPPQQPSQPAGPAIPSMYQPGGPTPMPFDPNYMLLELRNEYERKLQQYQTMWRRNLEEMDRLNRDLMRKNRELFRSEVKRVDTSLMKGKMADASSLHGPCQEFESKLSNCYQLNGKTSLECGPLVKEFSKCIDQARLDALKQKKDSGSKNSSSVSI